MRTKRNKDIGSILPTEEAFNAWREIIYFASGIAFTLDVVKAAYFIDLGYRAGMNTYSVHSFKDALDQPWRTAVSTFKTFDSNTNTENWSEELDTDEMETLVTRCCLIQFGMEHPDFGDSDEYKSKFREIVDAYNAANKFVVTQPEL